MASRISIPGVVIVIAATLGATACSGESVPTAPATQTVVRTVFASNQSSATVPAVTSKASAPAAVTSAAKAPISWSSTFKRVSTGILRIDNICDTAARSSSIGTGTGFHITPKLVATVAHVVEGQGALRVTSPTTGLVQPAQVVGLDHDDDLALLETPGPITGHTFTLAKDAPDIGTEIAAIGFPLAKSMQLTIGNISGVHDHRNIGGEFDLSDVLLSDVALNPGNSGGPWVTQSGEVVALAESGPPFDEQDQTRAQGNNGGVSAASAVTHFESWRKAPRPQAGRGCQPDSALAGAIETLELYFYEINSSDYASAYAQLYSDNHPISGLSLFIDGVQSSTDYASDGSGAAFSVVNSGRSGGHVYVDVTFRSQQHAAQGPHGETCTDWTLRYTFRAFDSAHRELQLIYSSPSTPGTAGHRAC